MYIFKLGINYTNLNNALYVKKIKTLYVDLHLQDLYHLKNLKIFRVIHIFLKIHVSLDFFLLFNDKCVLRLNFGPNFQYWYFCHYIFQKWFFWVLTITLFSYLTKNYWKGYRYDLQSHRQRVRRGILIINVTSLHKWLTGMGCHG